MSVDIDETEKEQCFGCDSTIDTETDSIHCFYKNGDYYFLCGGCYDEDLEYASTVYRVVEGTKRKYYIGDWVKMDEYGDTVTEPMSREYISTDAWRGYYETSVEGYTEVLGGWTTGGWDDAVARRKAEFNEWAESVLEGTVTAPFEILFVLDRTSNVFSQSVRVLVRDTDEFVKYFGTMQIKDLKYALS